MTDETRVRFPLPLLCFWFRQLLPTLCLMAAMIFLMQIAISGIVHDNDKVKTLLNFIDALPPIIKAALGGDALQVGNVEGLIAIGYNHPLVLILFMLFAVGTPTGLLTGEVQRGTMELILSRSATKTQVYICAGLLTLIGMVGLVVAMFMGTVVATNIYDFGVEVPLYPFVLTAVNGGLLAAAIGAISLLAASTFRRRGTAVSVAVTYIVLNYFISIITEWWPSMRRLHTITIFNYFNGHKIFVERGWPISELLVLTAILAAASVTGAIIWQRRDLPL